MPIITSRHSLPDGLVSWENKGDKFRMTHVENIAPVALSCKEMRKDPNRGFSKKRMFQHIARIPALVFFENKQLTNPDGKINKKELKKFLQSPNGEIFKTVEKGI